MTEKEKLNDRINFYEAFIKEKEEEFELSHQ